MTAAAAAAPVALTALLAASVALRVVDWPAPAATATAKPGPSARVEALAPAGIAGVDRLVLRVPWCPAPVEALIVPAWLSAVDLHALSGPEGDAVYSFAGHRVPGAGVNALVTAMHLALRLARAMRLVSAAAADADAAKLFIPARCRTDAEPRLSALAGEVGAWLHAAHVAAAALPQSRDSPRASISAR